MSFNGSGTFNRLYSWVQDAINGIKISSTRMDAEMDGMATGLSTCVTKDGQTTPTANLPMGGFIHTGVGNATARTNYAAASQVQDSAMQYGTTVAGTANAITFNTTPVFAAYAAGQKFSFIATAANTTAVTVNINSLGAVAITKNGSTALVANDIPAAGALVQIEYDGTRFQLYRPATLSGFTGIVPPNQGGTGIANNALSTLAITGAFATTFTISNTTALTLPISGTVMVLENTQSVTGAISFTNAATKILVTNANANAQFAIEQTSTGDASMQFLLTGVQAWVIGIDNSDSDKFKISAANDGFATPLFTITTAGATTFGGNISGTGAWTLTGGAGNMTIVSGTGNSRTMILQTTTSGGTATTALTLGADQSATFAGHLVVEGVTSTGATGTGKFVFDNTPTVISPVISTGLTASGSASNDFSASTGTFKTSTGANQLSGAVTISDATTPSLTTASGKTNTGFVQINGKTSGALKITAADAAAQTVTLSLAAQTTGAATLTIPDMANVNKTVAWLESPSFTTPAIGAATGTSVSLTALSKINATTGNHMATAQTGTLFQTGQADSTQNGIELNAFAGACKFIGTRANTSSASPSALASPNVIVGMDAIGYGATGYSGTQGTIRINANGTWSDTSYPTQIILSTTPAASTTLTTAVIVDSNQNLKIVSSTARSTTDGTGLIALFNGTAPVGTLTNGISLYSSGGQAYAMDSLGNASLISQQKSVPAISATKTGNFTVLSYTPPAAAGQYEVSGVITTTSSTNTGTVQFTLDYVDSQGTTHTADVIPLCDAAGSIATTKTGASKEFHSMDWRFTINNSATAIVLKVVITGSVSYTVTGSITQIA